MTHHGQWKVVIVGAKDVGKSSFLQRFADGSYAADGTPLVDTYETSYEVEGRAAGLSVCTCDARDFENYAQNVSAAVMMFSTVDQRSFRILDALIQKIRLSCGDIPLVLVESKVDLIDQTELNSEEVASKAKSLRLRLYRSSAKENMNVKEVFMYLGEKCMTRTRPNSLDFDSVRSRSRTPSPLPMPRPNSGNLMQGMTESEPLKRRTGGKKQVKCPVM